MRLVSDDVWAVMTIWQEARGESLTGKICVARVIRNRMAMRYFSDGTVTGTVLRPYQFSGWNTSDRNRLEAATIDTDFLSVQECQQAWEASEHDDAGIKDAVLYYNPRYVERPPWATADKYVKTEGNHWFYLK